MEIQKILDEESEIRKSEGWEEIKYRVDKGGCGLSNQNTHSTIENKPPSA